MPVPPFNHITATYTRLHAWMYETIVAPAVYLSRHVIDERFLARLPPGAAHILDVGSGGGLFTNYIADQRADVHIIGLDLSQPQIERASRLTFPRDRGGISYKDRKRVHQAVSAVGDSAVNRPGRIVFRQCCSGGIFLVIGMGSAVPQSFP